MAIQSKNPTTEKVVKKFKEISDYELERKISLADDAFKKWRGTSFAERKKLFLKLAKYLRQNIEHFTEIQTLEMGKTKKSGILNMEKCIALCEYYANNIEKILKDEIIKTEARKSYITFNPLGVVLAIMPWNFPYWQVYRFAIPSLIAGNVGLLKHASNVPQCAELIEESFRASGFPEGIFQNLLLSSSRVGKVIRNKRVVAVALTGSEKAGSEVAKIAGEEIKKTVLELGGSDPFIVFADADIEYAATNAVLARLQGNTGQSCISAKRFIVEKSILKEFTEKVVDKFEKLIVGDPKILNTDVGPLATEQVLKDIEKQLRISLQKGAKVLTGGKRLKRKGYFYPPTVVINVVKGMPLYDEEVFGPILSITSFKTEEEAILIANNTPYGLGANIFTNNKNRIERIIPRIDAGSVFLNGFVKSDVRMPFGGIKKSGFGRELSSYGVKEFMNVKSVWIK